MIAQHNRFKEKHLSNCSKIYLCYKAWYCATLLLAIHSDFNKVTLNSMFKKGGRDIDRPAALRSIVHLMVYAEQVWSPYTIEIRSPTACIIHLVGVLFGYAYMEVTVQDWISHHLPSGVTNVYDFLYFEQLMVIF